MSHAARLRVALRWAARRDPARPARAPRPALLAARCSGAARAVDDDLCTLRLLVESPLATEALAHFFAASLRAGDCYLLHGGVGAGKSFFSRAFVRAAARDDALPVPSPTFLLQNVYDDHPGPPIHHYDLYRLTQPHDLARLDLPASLPAAVSLIEWPDRMGAAAPRAHLALRIAILGEAEQRALQERLQQGAAAAQQQQQGEDEEEAGKEEEEEEEEDGGGDGRWRRIELAGQGQRWRRMLEPLGGHVRAHGRELGLWLDPETAG